jgi:hypothetical protein
LNAFVDRLGEVMTESNARRERDEQEASRDAGAGRAAWHQSKPTQKKIQE